MTSRLVSVRVAEVSVIWFLCPAMGPDLSICAVSWVILLPDAGPEDSHGTRLGDALLVTGHRFVGRHGQVSSLLANAPGDLSRHGGLLRPALCTGTWCSAGRGRFARVGTVRVVPPAAAGPPGWPGTSSARPRRGRGTPRRGRCCFAGAAAQAR